MNRRTAPICAAALLVLSACSDSGRSIEAFCDQLDVMQDADVGFEQIDLDDSVAVHDSLAEFSQHFETLSEVAPEEIREQTSTVARFGVALADAALAANPDDPFDRAALLAEATTQEPGAPEAMEEVAAFAARNCAAAP